MLSAGRVTVNRGMGRYTQQQLREVLRRDRSNDYILVCRAGADESQILPEIAQAANVTIGRLPPLAAGGGDPNAPERALRASHGFLEALAELRLDLFHATTPFLLNDVVPPRFDAAPRIATHYDLIPLVFPDHYFPARRSSPSAELYLRALALQRQADRLLAISDFVRREAADYLGLPLDRIDVAPPFAEEFFRPLAPAERHVALATLAERVELPEHFVLCVSHVHHAKNLPGFFDAWALVDRGLRRRFPLVLACDLNANDRRAVERWLEQRGLAGEVRLTGFVSDGELVGLMNAADLFVHASLYEGFGLPVLEAMQCGAAVLTTRAASLPEVAGEAAELVEADSPGALARAIGNLLCAPERRRELRELGLERARHFTPAALGEATLAAYQAASRGGEPSPCQPARLAVWSPVPAQPSGIAEYTEELVGELARWAEVELFVDDGVLPEADLLRAYPVWHHAAFARRAARQPFDAVLYQLGASPFHVYQQEALERWPGIVTLHDLTWGAQLRATAYLAGDPDRFRGELAAQAGTAALAEYDAIERLPPAEHAARLEEFLNQHYLLGRVAGASHRLVTHFPWAAEELERRYANTPVDSFPMGVRDPRERLRSVSQAALRERFGIAADAFLVGAFGILDPVKRVASVLRAVADLAGELPRLTFVAAGAPASASHAAELTRLIAELGLADRARLLGRVGADEFEDLLLAVDVVVNLRFPFRKQLSATLMRALAAGKPVLVTELVEWRHLPAACCLPVPADEREVATLTDHLRRLALQPEERLQRGAAARRYFVEGATLRIMGEHYRETVEHTLGRRLVPPAGAAAAAPGARGGISKLCELEDFTDAALAPLLRELFPEAAEVRGPSFPQGAECRRQWEAAQALRAIRALAAPTSGRRVLAFGCGASPLPSLLGCAGYEVTEIDGLPALDGGALEPTGFLDRAFDLVLCLGGLGRLGDLDEVAATAAELGRLVRPDGLVLVTGDFQLAGPIGESPPQGHLALTADELARDLVSASGLAEVETLVTAISPATRLRPRPPERLCADDPPETRFLPRLLEVRGGRLLTSFHLALRGVADRPAPAPELAARLERGRQRLARPALAAATGGAPGDRPVAAPPPLFSLPAPPMLAPVTKRPRRDDFGQLAEVFGRWDALRARSGLESAASGGTVERAFGFARRTAARVRDLGISGDLLRDVLRALVDRATELDQRLAAVETEAEYAHAGPRLQALEAAVAARDAEMRQLHRELEALTAAREIRAETLAADLGLAEPVELAEREDRLPSDLRSAERSSPRRVAEPARGGGTSEAGEPAGEGASLAASGHPGASGARARSQPATPLALGPQAIGPLLAMAEQTGADGGEVQSVDVSFQSIAAEDLLLAAFSYLGERLASRGPEYRSPNDLWVHFDFTRAWSRAILVANAAARLRRGGRLVLITAPSEEPPPHHAALELVADATSAAPLGAPLRMLVWRRR